MTRGCYRPLDRRANPVIGWGAQYAVDHAALRALEHVLPPVIPVIGAVDRAVRAHAGARGVYTGLRMMGGRADAEGSLARVGGAWWHGTEDRVVAISAISAAITDLVRDLMTELQQRRDAAEQHNTPDLLRALTADVAWVTADVQPTVAQWQAFVARQAGSMWTMVATDWTVFEDWLDRVRRLRQLARARGFHLTTPEPHDLPKTVWQRGAEGEGGPAAWLGVLKISVAAAVGLAGFIGLYAALRGKHP
jgi:hypothetical protein